MSIKKTNNYLLKSVILTLFFAIIMAFFPSLKTWGIDELIKYATIFLIGLVTVKKCGGKLSEYLPYNVPMKFRTALIIILLVILVSPIMDVLVALGGMIFGNAYEDIAELYFQQQSDQSFIEQLFVTAVIPAVFEEMFYRGFFYNGYKRGKGIRTAIILTGILFGTFHMVAQQALYAAFAGVMLAVIRELTGSMWPGMWFHLLNNGSAVVGQNLAAKFPGCEKYFLLSFVGFEKNKIISVVTATVCVVLVIFLLKQIAKIEGKEEEFKTFFREDREKSDEKLVTGGLVLTLLIQLGVMFSAGFLVDKMKDYIAKK